MIKILLKMQARQTLHMMLGKAAKKKAVTLPLLFLVLFFLLYFTLFIAGFTGMLFFNAGQDWFPSGYGWLFFTMAGIVEFALIFLGSIYFTKQQLYEANDNAILLTLPIPHSIILSSRMIWLLILDYYLGAVCAVPVLVSLLVLQISPAAIACYALIALTIPLFAQSLSAALAYALHALTARMRRKTLFQTVLTLCILGAYFYFLFSFSLESEALAGLRDTLAPALTGTPLGVFGAIQAEGAFLPVIAILLVFIALFMLLIWLLSRSFARLTTGTSVRRRATFRRDALRGVRSPLRAQIGLELRRFFGSTPYLVNCGLGCLLALACGIFAVVQRNALPAELSANLGTDATALLACALLCGLGCTTLISAPSITLEGRMLWILRSAPVPASVILRAKALTHVIIAAPPYLIASLCLIFAIRPGFTASVCLVLAPQIFITACAFIGVFINLYVHNLAWENETQAVKQGLNLVLTMLAAGGMLTAAALLSLPVLLLFSAAAAAVVACLPLLVLAFLFERLTVKVGAARFDRL